MKILRKIDDSIIRNILITESSWALFGITRFLLAVIVMLSIGHLNFYTDKMPIFIKNIGFLGGKAAVMGFLLISGISIGHSYYKNEKGFISRRFLRIYPLYFIAVLFTVFLQWYLGSQYQISNRTLITAGFLTSIVNFLLLQDIVGITITYNEPLWSLSLEWYLYLLAPFIIKLRLQYILMIVLISILTFAFQNNYYLFGHKVLIFGWSFILGFVISTRKTVLFTLPFFVIGTVLIFLKKNLFAESLSWVTFIFVIGVVVFCLFRSVRLSKKVVWFFNFLGTLSYPLYLFHIPIYLILYHFGIRNAYVLVILVFVLIIPINYIFDDWLKKIFWKPLVFNFNRKLNILNFKNKFFNYR